MADLAHVSPLAGLTGRTDAAIAAAGVEIREARLAAQIVLAAHGDPATLINEVQQSLGLALPAAPNTRTEGDDYAVWLDPARWLLAMSRGDRFALPLDSTLSSGHRSDVTDGLAVLDLAGPNARELIAMGCSIDLHASVMTHGRSARTLLAQAPVLLYPLDTAGSFRVHVDRALLPHVWAWLKATSGAVGQEHCPGQ